MALTLYQNPKDDGKYIHQLRYPIHYTALSDNYTDTKMRYNYQTITENGEIHNSMIPPSITEGYGIYTNPPILYNLTKFTFQPRIKEITKVENFLINYKMELNEHNTSYSTTNAFDKCIGIRCYKEDFDYENYILDGTDKYFLTEWTESTREVRLEDWGTQRLIAGMLGYTPSPITEIKSWFYKIRLTYYNKTNDFTYFYESSNPNQYFTNTHHVGVSSNNNTIENLDEYVLDIPAGPANINKLYWTMSGYLDASGGYHPITNPTPYYGVPMLSVGDEYEIQSFCWPQGDNGKTSAPIRYKVIDECNRDYCQIAWENRVGGVEYLTVTMNKYLSMEVEKSTYLKDKYTQGYDGDAENVGYDNYSRGETNFYNKTTKKYTIYTDWVDDTQIEELKTLWDSKNVYLRIDEDWVPIIITNTSINLQNDRNGLKNYEINIALSNKEYR